MVEPQIVVLVVAGSSPVGHPWNFGFSSADFRFANRRSTAALSNRKSVIENPAVPVAQLDRASDFGSEGWGFESLQARSLTSTTYVRSRVLKKKVVCQLLAT